MVQKSIPRQFKGGAAPGVQPIGSAGPRGGKDSIPGVSPIGPAAPGGKKDPIPGVPQTQGPGRGEKGFKLPTRDRDGGTRDIPGVKRLGAVSSRAGRKKTLAKIADRLKNRG